jgi:hypothetical protein
VAGGSLLVVRSGLTLRRRWHTIFARRPVVHNPCRTTHRLPLNPFGPAVIIGAFLTPGDLVWTTVAMAVPLYLLYELSIVLSYPVYRRRARRRWAA